MTARKKILNIMKQVNAICKPIDDLIEAYETEKTDLEQDQYYSLRSIQVALDDLCLDLNTIISMFGDLDERLRNTIEKYI
jgi:hypothetical protein